MEIKNAQYKQLVAGKNEVIKATIDNVECFVPLDPDNRHYAEILEQVKKGTLTIKDAE